MFAKKEKSKEILNDDEIKDLQDKFSEKILDIGEIDNSQQESEGIEILDISEEPSNSEKILKEQIENLDDKLKRTIAEFDNFRKRTIKEKSTMYDEGIRITIEKILPVLDNLERAVSTNTESSGLKQGVEMTLKQFTEILNSLDVEEIEAQDKTFDPNFHLAVMHIEDENYEANTVIEVLQKGYIHKDKVIRYSTVKVAN